MSRDYCFTAWEEPKWDEKNVRYICWGVEICPTTKKQHWQGFAIFNRTCRYPKAKQWIGAGECHVESRKGTRPDARTYCTKEGSFVEFGIFEGVTKEELFKKPISYLKEFYPEFYCRYHRGLEKLHVDKGAAWRNVRVIWLWGKAGCGKTRYVMEMDDVYKHDGMKWWDGYDGEDIILLDDFDKSAFDDRRYMLNILDGYRLRLEVKGGFTYAKWSQVYITTNWNPYEILCNDEAMSRRITEVVTM